MRIVDRKKDMILVSGFNVYPNELEDVLATLPGVLQCAAIGIPDEKSGESIKVFVVVKPGATLTKEQVMQHMHDNLTGYKRPKAVEFRDSLPTTNVGKILRRELRDEEPEESGPEVSPPLPEEAPPMRGFFVAGSRLRGEWACADVPAAHHLPEEPPWPASILPWPKKYAVCRSAGVWN